MDLTSLEEFFKANKKPSVFNIFHLDSHLASAFQTDCENFLHTFKQGQNYSFSSFAELWRETCFLEIFKFQENILMLQAFLENCFFITKKFLFSPDIYNQTGALYILYGLYYKQPIKRWVKVRLVQSEFDKLNEIVTIHKSNQSLDPLFVFTKMRIDGAFDYCALNQPVGLHSKSLKCDLRKEISRKSPKESVLVKFKDMLEQNSDLVQFEEIDGEYQKLSQKYNEEYGKLFVFPPSSVNEDLKRAYGEAFDVDLGEQSDEDKLKQTKSKAMTNMNAVYRGEKKILTALDLPSTSK